LRQAPAQRSQHGRKFYRRQLVRRLWPTSINKNLKKTIFPELSSYAPKNLNFVISQIFTTEELIVWHYISIFTCLYRPRKVTAFLILFRGQKYTSFHWACDLSQPQTIVLKLVVSSMLIYHQMYVLIQY
jgi:hypothetical protein